MKFNSDEGFDAFLKAAMMLGLFLLIIAGGSAIHDYVMTAKAMKHGYIQKSIDGKLMWVKDRTEFPNVN